MKILFKLFLVITLLFFTVSCVTFIFTRTLLRECRDEVEIQKLYKDSK